LRARHGCTAQRVMQLPDDGNELFVTHDFPTAEQAGSFAQDPGLREAMGRAGVEGLPRIEITPDGKAATDQLLPGIRALEKSILSALSPDEGAHLLDLLAKILAQAAEVAAGQPGPLSGQRIRPARLGGR
jgi:hypothetical protein